ncbi:hypothetical protein T03_5830 [Trichinella britovi]|uniref:Uncharacterized protein n=1 Tax=Trichinella britovi TaxID=45882 RepID=A0A0V1CPD0_TRIBR|nr:hypothetical protein T03_5830 [Trichinella britovi]
MLCNEYHYLSKIQDYHNKIIGTSSSNSLLSVKNPNRCHRSSSAMKPILDKGCQAERLRICESSCVPKVTEDHAHSPDFEIGQTLEHIHNSA